MEQQSNGNEMVSFGCGVNSVAMTIMLVDEGWRGPIVFADPGAEHPDTYCYLSVFGKWLKPYGLSVLRIAPDTYPDLYPPSYRMALIEKCERKRIVPIMLNRWCTIEYKRKPLVKWAKRNGIGTQILGIAAEESHRVYTGKRAELALEYPLVDKGH